MTLSNATVTIRRVTTTSGDLGDTTETTADEVLDWALFTPRSSNERSDPRAPAVITAATIYGPFGTELDADDLIIVADHSPSANGTWQVEGLPGQWKLNDWAPGFEVAVTRASAV